MTTNPTDFRFQVRKDYKFRGDKKAYEGIVTVSIYTVYDNVPEIIRSTDSFMGETLVASWGYLDQRMKAAMRDEVILGETSKEIKQLVDKRADELVEQLRAIYCNNMKAITACPTDSVTEFTWDSIS